MTGLRDGSPADAGLSPARLDHARELTSSWVAAGDHPAIVALVARRGVIAWHEAFGVLGPETDDPPLPLDALFPLASLGKTLTATALMTLVEEGRVGLTRRVADYVPEFDGAGKDKVLVHHLLTHTSGLDAMEPDAMTAEVAAHLGAPRLDPALHPLADVMFQLARERALRAEPGVEMCYTDANYELAGEIVRRVAGVPLDDALRSRVFAPVGMRDSFCVVPTDDAPRVVRAVPGGFAGPLWAMGVPAFATGSGLGYCSTALDMARFGQAFLDGGVGEQARLVGPATVAAMTTNQIPGVPGILPFQEWHAEGSWGLGWGVACHERWSDMPVFPPGTFWHSGASGVLVWCDPAHQLVGAFFAVMNQEMEPERILWHGDGFVDAVTAAIDD